jgi:ribosome-binding ATPase YchF (GTP1/OBG family)
LERELTVDRSLLPQVELLREIRSIVASGRMVSSVEHLMAGSKGFADLHLLTAKPVIYVFNLDEEGLRDYELRDRLSGLVAPARSLFLDAQIEAEMGELEEEDRRELLDSVGQEEPGLAAVIRAAYETLGLQSFLTTGEKETRAWTVRSGATAPEAAGVIHTDFQRGFIAAEVVAYADLVAAGSWVNARARGLVRTEGKTYVMRPDDVVEFRFNV